MVMPLISVTATGVGAGLVAGAASWGRSDRNEPSRSTPTSSSLPTYR